MNQSVTPIQKSFAAVTHLNEALRHHHETGMRLGLALADAIQGYRGDMIAHIAQQYLGELNFNHHHYQLRRKKDLPLVIAVLDRETHGVARFVAVKSDPALYQVALDAADHLNGDRYIMYRYIKPNQAYQVVPNFPAHLMEQLATAENAVMYLPRTGQELELVNYPMTNEVP